METNEIYEAIRIKNLILKNQAKRIKLLEEKMSELRRKYFQLKYADVIVALKPVF